MQRAGSHEVDEYVAKFDGVTKERLQQVRQIVLGVLPDAEERLSYGMPSYFVRGKAVIYFSGYDHHLGVYPGRVATGDLASLIGPYLSGKSTARFPHDQPLPADIIKQLVLFRRDEVLTAAG